MEIYLWFVYMLIYIYYGYINVRKKSIAQKIEGTNTKKLHTNHSPVIVIGIQMILVFALAGDCVSGRRTRYKF